MDVDGGNPSALVGATRPVDSVTYSDLRGWSIGSSWPVETGVDASSFIGKLRGRVDGLAFDLPTDAQWEYVCRAGTVTALNNGKNLDAAGTNLSEVGRWGNNQTDGIGGYAEHATVGSYRSNSWGVFDMHGNVWEACLDWAGNNIGQDCEDPVGPVSGLTGKGRIARGGAWTSGDIGYNCRSATRVDGYIEGGNMGGFRLFLHNAPAVVEAPIVAPAGLTATTNRTGDVALSWEPVAGAYAYQIRRSKTGAFEDGTWLNTVTNTTYADWTAEARADYAYWVRAQFESGRVGQWSEAAEGSRHKYYSVHFNANGGTGTMVDLELRFDQPQALTANAFTKSGAVFAGWALSAGGSSVYADGETVENLTVEPGATVVLYAVWASSSYTVKFNKNASAATGSMADQTMTRNANAALRANAFVRAGYRFAGWATSASGAKVYDDKQSVKNITTGSSIPLYAGWEALTAQNGLYMVIDLSGGANASSYPVTYLSAVPSGGWTDTYKTTKLVLRRINPGTFTMGRSGSTSNAQQHQVTLNKAFYMGVFEVTEKQYRLVAGSLPQYMTSEGDAAACHELTYSMLRGTSNGSKWPNSAAVDSSSFIGKLRARTKFGTLDLPTEAQWEYVRRAGTNSEYGGLDIGDVFSYAWVNENANTKLKKVGTKKSTGWGIFDMEGNADEWCLDWYGQHPEDQTVDPKGPSSGSDRVVRGSNSGSVLSNTVWVNPGYRSHRSPGDNGYYGGCRLCVVVE